MDRSRQVAARVRSRVFTSLLVAAAVAGAGCAASPEEELAAQFEELRVCADGPTVRGIDVSYWQGTINWDQVAGAGVKFAIIRAGHGLEADTIFARNWREARRVGIIRGAYHYFEPDLDVTRQANIMISAMSTLEPDDLPPVLDIEDTGGLSASQIVSRARQWIELVEAATGRQVMIYTGKYFWQDNVGSSDAFVDHPLWIPQYGPTCPDLPSPWTDWVFFQTSSTGRVSGISGNVDLDLFNGDLAALRTFARGVAECGDGYCNGDETHDTCAMDCPICEAIPPEGRIVDDAEVCFEPGGDLTYWRREMVGHGGGLLWTYAVDGDTTYNFAVWNLDVAEAGMYRIEVHTPAPFAMSRMAEYRVRHAGMEDRFPLDQSAVDGWSTLADVQLAAGGDQWVRIDDNTGEARATETKIVADAIRLTRLDLPMMPVDPEPPLTEGDAGTGGGDGGLPDPESYFMDHSERPGPDDVASGCSATGMSARGDAAWIALVIAVWLMPRRARARARAGAREQRASRAASA